MKSASISTTLHRLEANDATIGGVLYTFPSGKSKQATWKSESQITDTLTLAKSCASQVRAQLMDEGATDDLDRTNWPSLVAGTQRHIQDFNARLGAQMSSPNV